MSVLSNVLLVPVLLGLMCMLRHRAPTLGNVGGTLALLGTLVSVGDAVSQLFIRQRVAPGAYQAQMTALLVRFDSSPEASIIFKIGGPAFEIGMVLLGIGLYRARAVPVWAAAGLPGGALLNIAGYVIGTNLVVAISSAVLLVCLAWIGRLILEMSASDWERFGAQPQTRHNPAEPAGLHEATGNS